MNSGRSIPACAPHGEVQQAYISPAAQAAGIHLTDQHQPVCAADQALICQSGHETAGDHVCETPCAKARKTVAANARESRYTDSGVPYGTPA